MELKEPRPKFTNLKSSTFLHLKKHTGHFNNYSVVITDAQSIKDLYITGCFGKGNLSRSYPCSRGDAPELLRKRVFNNRKKINTQLTPVKKVIVLPDSDSENDYFINLTPEYNTDSSAVKESLHLSLEESYFLSTFCKSLDVYHENNIITPSQMWTLFSNTDKYFIQNYAVYHYFRSKNWIVKPGIKFGGDYLLYKNGPAFYHATYLVIIDILDAKTLTRKTEFCRRSMDVMNIIGLNRLCESVGKELLICQILWPTENETIELNDLQKLQISEVLMRRWIPSENRVLDY